MSSTVFYDAASETAIISVQFELGGVPADPVTVSCVITEPSGTAVTHTYGGAAPADIAKEPGTGAYQLAVPCFPSVTGIDGLWGYVWVASGTVNDVQPGTWRVLPVRTSQLWYVGLEEMKDRLNVTDPDDDSSLQYAIAASAGWINDYCGQAFNRVTETRTFVPEDLWLLNIPPVVSVSALAIDRDGDGVFEEPWVQGTDYMLRIGPRRYNVNELGQPRPYRQVHVLQTGRLFPFLLPYGHQDKVQVTGSPWGWPAVPWQVSEANRILAAQVFKEKDAPFGIAGISDLGIARITSSPTLVMMLERFIAPRNKVGV